MRKGKFLIKKGIYQNPITILKCNLLGNYTHSPKMYRKQCRKGFFTKCIFGGPKFKKKKKKKKMELCQKETFCLLFGCKIFLSNSPSEVFCFIFFFIQCIALRYAENNPQKHFQPSAYFRGQHLAKIRELCKKAIFALKCVYRSSSMYKKKKKKKKESLKYHQPKCIFWEAA